MQSEAKQVFENAVELFKKGRFLDGISALSLLTDEENAFRYDALGARAHHWKYLSEYEKALADYCQMHEINPHDAEVTAALAELYLILGQQEKAVCFAIETLTRDSGNRSAAKTLLRAQEKVSFQSPEIHEQSNVPVRYINAAIDRYENTKSLFPTSVFPEIGKVLYTLTRMTRPQIVVETGTFLGYSTLHLGQALEDNQYGHLHAFDLFESVKHDDFEVEDSYAYVGRNLHDAGLSHRVSLHKGDSSRNIAKVFEGKSSCVDLAFIDGDHMIRGCLRDWAEIDKIMKPGGIMIFHDTIPENCHWLGPKYLLDKLSALQESYAVISMPSVEGFGVGIVQKRNDACSVTSRDFFPSWSELLAERLYWGKWWGSKRA